MAKPCEFPTDNHSDDRFAVWHGAETPIILCGFHEQNFLKEALAIKNQKGVA